MVGVATAILHPATVSSPILWGHEEHAIPVLLLEDKSTYKTYCRV